MFPPEYWSTSKKLMVLGAMAGGKLVEAEAVGNPLTFLTEKAKPLRSLLIPFTPVQSGTGDPSPENVRPITGWQGVTAWHTGKNLFDKSAKDTNNGYVENKYLINTGEMWEGSSYHVSEFIPVVDGAKYTLCPLGGRNPAVCFYDASKQFISGEKYDNRETITVTAPTNAFYCRISVANENEDTLQLVVGETASEYSPYTGQPYPVVFPAQGKNLLALPDADFTLKGIRYKVVNGAITLDGTSVGETSAASADFKTYLSFNLKAGTYYFNRHTYPNAVYFRSDVTGTDANLVTNKGSFTLEKDAKVWVAFYMYQRTFDNLSVPLSLYSGDTEQPYEPFDNTVYGGTLDMVTGVLTVDRATADLGKFTYEVEQTQGGNDYFVVYNAFPGAKKVGNNTVSSYVCGIYKTVRGTEIYFDLSGDYAISMVDSADPGIRICDNRFSTPTELKTALDGVLLCYELATPITYQLTPQQITAIAGQQNTIWSDTNGENTVVYLKKG